MKNFVNKIKKFWYFKVANPIVRTGESGGFRWTFRRFTLTIETLSGNFKVQFTAAEYPYGYLMAGEDSQTHGLAQRLYTIAMVMATEQKFVDDLDKAISAHEKRLQKTKPEEDVDERTSLEFEKSIQEHVELPEKERRKKDKEIDRRFKKAAKKANVA